MKACTDLYVALTATLLFCTSARAEWVNSLQPPGKPAGRVSVVKAGKPQGGIRLPHHPTPQETNAAAQLQLWIKEMTGATVPFNAGQTSRSCFAIRTDPSLGDEGYGITVNRGQIILSGGKTRGVMNAVYALLEEDLGCRFYANDSIRLPRTNTLSIAPVARHYIPQLKLRDPFYACAFDPAWDEKALARDFIQGHYGKAAPALTEYDALLERMRADHASEMASPAGGIRYPMDAPFITKPFVTQATDIFARAKGFARGDDELTRRVERAELPILYVQCVRGPEFVGESYGQVVGEFERIARREKVQFLEEGGPDFEGKLAGYKSHIPKAAATR